MPNPFHYRAVLNKLARCADAPYPPRVQVAAAITLAGELTPGTPRAQLARQMLLQANPYEDARHKLRDLFDRAAPLSLLSSEATDLTETQEEEAPEDDIDPL